MFKATKLILSLSASALLAMTVIAAMMVVPAAKGVQPGVTALVSTDAVGGQGNGESKEAWSSGGGRFVSFWSDAHDLFFWDTNRSVL
jgi:hypothetical protein